MTFIIDYFKLGLFTKTDMQEFVEVAFISSDQYKQATGEDYVAPATTAA